MSRPFESDRQRLCEMLCEWTGASAVTSLQSIQSLWSGYGEILRVRVQDASVDSVIAKVIDLTAAQEHPRGWASDAGHLRKLRSYDVEQTWYTTYADRCDQLCRVATCFGCWRDSDRLVFALEDLAEAGFQPLRGGLRDAGIEACLRWLARFHARFLGVDGRGLWPTGCYWHWETRQDEWQAMPESRLKQAARDIDRRLRKANHQAIVHGDAKIANFCFQEDQRDVAAVDFQYVGGGPGIKDVAYLLGGCMPDERCHADAADWLERYLQTLHVEVGKLHGKALADNVVVEWRSLYPVAWADFHRFLLGWCPGHSKLTSYSEAMVQRCLQQLADGR
ncbi:MAG: phosphotransferase [Planctomycetota bacterium]